MKLFLRVLDREVEELAGTACACASSASAAAFSPELHERMARAEARTAGNTASRLNIAVDYGGRWDIAHAARSARAEAAAGGRIAADAIDDGRVARALSLADLPEPDLFIRTGGDRRISNFLLWQLAYAEL